MKGGRIALPSEYFTGEQSENYSVNNVGGSSRNQLNCENFVGPDLHVNGGQTGGRRTSRRGKKQSLRTRQSRGKKQSRGRSRQSRGKKQSLRTRQSRGKKQSRGRSRQSRGKKQSLNKQKKNVGW